MLDVNDFTAIRISLASPEQIRSWSYGEITKPETINYRTLRPEKDGLFCEKIFGPTKDFECYCGKYKRIRYKGIVCDKCGVEVTRAKVRRERMGHIVLAAPVGHIWFVKGAPSRMSILLDISPRSLERVIYFAWFIITNVDEGQKKQALQRLQEDHHRELAKLEEALGAKQEEIRQRLEEAKNSLNKELADTEARLNEELAASLPQIMEKAASHQEAQEMIGQREAEIHQELDAKAILTVAAKEHLEHDAAQEIENLQRRFAQDKARIDEDTKTKDDEIDDIRPLVLLTEGKYREINEKYGSFFSAGMGAEAILEILRNVNLEDLREKLQREVNSTSGQRRKKATKRLRVAEAFRKSGNKPEWMVFTVLPVLPPDLRPMVQLNGGRFATSDLNDLYRRVINRNNRLRRLLELEAPGIIVRNEKRMLQEAVDSLMDNGRRGRAVSGAGNHKLKSMSDMLRGKQGRFRQNLLGKRVDYSGRSVIVVGPELKLHQCGLPKRMALELFKPFVMRRLVEKGLAHNIKIAKRIVERVRPEVWDILEEVIKDRPVFLNRAPTLWRLGIQAFMPVLIEGSAIQLHPLVCTAFNADFDGDQMAIHIPLSQHSVEEAKTLMLSSRNLLSPSSGDPVVAPTLDIVLGCYYMTMVKPGVKGEGKVFSSFDEAKLAYDLGLINLQAEIQVRGPELGETLKTSPGRIIFNEVLPPQLGFRNQIMDKGALKDVIAECHRNLGIEKTAQTLDRMKDIGFHYATKAGITIAANDLAVPIPKAEILGEADRRIAETEKQYQMGLITQEERYDNAIKIWTEAGEKISEAISQTLDPFGSLHMMSNSGAKGNIAQIRQMAGMRGLMADPSGRIIELPIRSSFREGLTVLEYFISTHGARKGLADTALRTSDSGYLTRRLVDVAQDVIILEEDCGTTAGVWVFDASERGFMETLYERILGRLTASPIAHPKTGEILVEQNQAIDEEKARDIVAAGVERVHVRSILGCQAKRGVCRACYGWSMALGNMAPMREAVGIIAAQSIGEPGTQLTMRTFHTGGVAGLDITSGLPRIEELFEARVPKGMAIISEIDGVAEVLRTDNIRKIKVVSSELYRDEYPLPPNFELLVENGQTVEVGTVLARPTEPEATATEEGGLMAWAEAPVITARMAGQMVLEQNQLAVFYEEREEREYVVPPAVHILVESGVRVKAGDRLTEGSLNPQDILRVLGREAVQAYLVEEVQKVYRSQGVNINDKHIEIIVRQMLKKVRVDSPGDTDMLPGELVDHLVYEERNARVLAEGGEPATAETVLLGVTKASLSTSSWLAAASFQETTRVLTEAAINGALDRLQGLKENVIIGKLVPAQGYVPSLPAPKPPLEVLPPL